MKSFASRYKLTILLTSFVRGVFSFAELLIMVRIILDFLKASEDAFFVEWMNRFTDPLLWPFVGTFAPYELDGGYVVELYEILAFVVYAFLGYLITRGIAMLGEHKSILRRDKLDSYR